MSEHPSVDEYLGFVSSSKVAASSHDGVDAPSDAVDVGAYEDGWYQVLKAQAGEADPA